MASVALAARLVEVIADRGQTAAERYRYGSGCIVRGRTVLTAAHVVSGAKSVQVRDSRKTMYSATMDPQFVGNANCNQVQATAAATSHQSLEEHQIQQSHGHMPIIAAR
jgi:hypothetical protein